MLRNLCFLLVFLMSAAIGQTENQKQEMVNTVAEKIYHFTLVKLQKEFDAKPKNEQVRRVKNHFNLYYYFEIDTVKSDPYTLYIIVVLANPSDKNYEFVGVDCRVVDKDGKDLFVKFPKNFTEGILAQEMKRFEAIYSSDKPLKGVSRIADVIVENVTTY
ncbi:MAG: hypothetical protein AMQ22_00210 [Candidatus Methanofastidiosum methylothiophilum]|uniref:Uncharacterized protein n=1 Tax=Candidatus Methanofastidiosum methylothiophilum TaxID=1705564 RepID=A0A150IS93_9EURY|nr:MAG: hypothetical protein APG11_00832 [Candidatus Methanofastidiosum methylthiophilus]KYC53539.1 MAG: hypothetical protein AMQ22_00210 [Candidatus Methanofastidiosum methylthiophilus]